MPELPEVETVCRGIAPHIENNEIKDVIVRNPNLRYIVPDNMSKFLIGNQVETVSRRGKYILISVPSGTIIIHLGMAGTLRIVTDNSPPEKHDHFDMVFDSCILRYQDHRRFGCFLFEEGDPLQHKLLSKLGPEPLTDEFNGKYLFDNSRNRTKAVKLFLMDSHIVVGAGNIYANEALFASGIHPKKPAGKISLKKYELLADNLKKILEKSIAAGGTTIQDYVNSEGKPGYFQQELFVYGKTNVPCSACTTKIKSIRLGQRSTFFCPKCQKL